MKVFLIDAYDSFVFIISSTSSSWAWKPMWNVTMFQT